MFNASPFHAAVASSDLARSRAWYEEKLGLTPKLEEGPSLWYEFAPGTWLMVYESQYAGTAKNTVAGWTVEGIGAVMTALRAGGIAFEDYDFGNGMATVDGLMTVGPYQACWFKDPDGNTFEISEVDRSATG